MNNARSQQEPTGWESWGNIPRTDTPPGNRSDRSADRQQRSPRRGTRERLAGIKWGQSTTWILFILMTIATLGFAAINLFPYISAANFVWRSLGSVPLGVDGAVIVPILVGCLVAVVVSAIAYLAITRWDWLESRNLSGTVAILLGLFAGAATWFRLSPEDIASIQEFMTLGFGVVFGIIVWALLQTFEVYPKLLKYDRQLSRTIIDEYQRQGGTEYQISEEDPAPIRALKSWYNGFPTLGLRWANRAQVFAYVIDAAICITIYPPAEGGIMGFLFALVTLRWGLINWGSVLMIVVTMFIVEWSLDVLFVLAQSLHYIKMSKKTQRA